MMDTKPAVDTGYVLARPWMETFGAGYWFGVPVWSGRMCSGYGLTDYLLSACWGPGGCLLGACYEPVRGRAKADRSSDL